jgi:hypothetical protein
MGVAPEAIAEIFGYRLKKIDRPVPYMKEICPRGNNNIVIIIFLIHDNVYIPW